MSEPTSPGNLPLDVHTIAETVRQTLTTRPVPPTAEDIADLHGRLRGHLGLLLGEDLGDEDVALKALRRQAESLLSLDTSQASRFEAWEHTRILAQLTRTLLARHRAR